MDAIYVGIAQRAVSTDSGVLHKLRSIIVVSYCDICVTLVLFELYQGVRVVLALLKASTGAEPCRIRSFCRVVLPLGSSWTGYSPDSGVIDGWVELWLYELVNTPQNSPFHQWFGAPSLWPCSRVFALFAEYWSDSSRAPSS